APQVDAGSLQHAVVIELAEHDDVRAVLELVHGSVFVLLCPLGRAVVVDGPLDIALADGQPGRVLVTADDNAVPASLLLGGALGFLLLSRGSPRGKSDARDYGEYGQNQNSLHRILPEFTAPDGASCLTE